MCGIDATMLSKPVRDPRRALLRLVLRSRLARLDVEVERNRLLAFLSARYNVDGLALLDEYRESSFRHWFGKQRTALARFAGPHRLGTTGEFGCEALYLLVRAARPRTILTTQP